MTETRTTAEGLDAYGRFSIVTREIDGENTVSVHREPVSPGRWVSADEWVDTDLSDKPQAIQDFAAAQWTEGVVNACKAAFPWEEPIVSDAPPVPSLYAVAQLAIADGEITGFDIYSKLAGGFVLDVGMYYMLFSEIQPDTAYLAKAYDGGLVRSYVAQDNKFTDGFIISVVDANGDPVDVPNLSLEIIRVS